MKAKIAFVLFSVVCLCFGQIPPDDPASQTCLSQCQQQYPLVYNRPAPCCNCCNNSTGQTCHETSIRLACCNSDQAFCGCLSGRAFCAGSLFNSTVNVNPFGVCYDPTNVDTGSCCYNSVQNAWGLCPRGTSCCGPTYSLRYNCCTEREECIQDTTSADLYYCRNVDYGNNGPCADKNCLFGTEQQRCCNDISKGALCYKPETHMCRDTTTASGQKGYLLCAKADGVCGSQCYDMNTHKCCSGNLYSRNDSNAPCM